MALGEARSKSIKVRCQVFLTFAEAVEAASDASDIAVEIPIGLTEREPRECDRLAHHVLGPRGMCVFPAPPRPVLAAKSYGEANRLQRDLCGRGLSRQAYGIMPKISEVDRYLRSQAGGRGRVWEVHPEICFMALNGGTPIMAGKKTLEGGRARRALLAPLLLDLDLALRETLATWPRRVLGADDVLDAIVACVTAANWVPEATIPRLEPPADRHGLPMQMRSPSVRGRGLV